jgi:ADP-ribose pyrophosphatase YjhB (NUDIX family)
MTPELSRFLESCTLLCEGEAIWLDGAVRLRVRALLTEVAPPRAYVTSARCLVFRGLDEILVQRDIGSTHILPCGRLEPQESAEQALHREVREETGWQLAEPRAFGVLHFHHLTSNPPGSAYPYPDFVQVVYAARAVSLDPAAKVDDGHELESSFRTLNDVLGMSLGPGQRELLTAWLSARRQGRSQTSVS